MSFIRSNCSRKIVAAGAVVIALQVVSATTFGVSTVGSWISNVCQLCCNALAVFTALCAARRASGGVRRAWLCVAAGLGTWMAANVSWTFQVNWLGTQVPQSSLTNFAFIAYGIPLGLALLAENEEESSSSLPRLLDVLQFALLGAMLFIDICYLPRLNPEWLKELSGNLVQIELIACVFLLAAFLLRSLYASSIEFRGLYRRVAFFLCAYALIIAVPPITGSSWYLPSGTWYGLVFSVPFVACAIAIGGWRGDTRPVAESGTGMRSPIASAAVNFVPALVPIMLITLGAVVEEQSRPPAIIIGSLSLAAFGLRFVLVQAERERDRYRLAEAVRRLEESSENSRSLFLDHPLPMWLYSRDSFEFIEVNNAAVARYGYTRDEFSRLTVLDIRPPEERARFIKSVSRGPRRALLWKHRTKSGELFDVEIMNHQLLYEGRCAELIVAVDVSERLKAQRALEDSERLYRAMFEDAPYALFRVSTDGNRFLSANGAMMSLLGYESARELLAVPIATGVFVNPAERDKLLESSDSKHRCQAEVKWLRKNGDRIDVRLTGKMIRDASGGGLDILEVAAEDVSETRRLQDQLLHAQKMESIGTLAGGVAHDFNNILMITSAYSEMLETDLAEQPKLQACATEIRKAVVRASAITSQLLAFSRKQQVNPVVIDAGAEIAELRPMLQRLCGENVQVVVECGLHPIVIEVDRGQFAQVMINLAANARDAMPQGGQITIVSATENDSASIVFTDNGVGMPDTIKAKIFEPFFTTKDIGKGTGLGLATVYGIVKSTGGDIQVESQTGQGTTFKLLFPLLDRSRLSCAWQVAQVGNGARGTILIADDEGSLCSAICDYLESKGHAVFVSRNGQDALRIARELPHVDVLLSDVAMPGMRGPELARSLKTLHPQARVLLMTGHNELGGASEIGVDAELLMKPVALAELEQRISRLIMPEASVM